MPIAEQLLMATEISWHSIVNWYLRR